MNRLKTKAFTLAEVLVTLMIIGVISALTIPSLKESADKSANKAALQKAYATASNAFASLKAEYGPPMYWLITSDIDNSDEAYESGNRVFQTGKDKGFAWMLQKKINIGQAAGIPPAGYQIKTLSGSNFVSGDNLAKINNINVHASLLPRWRGGAPIHRAIINGDTKTGITIMKMVQKMDAGCMYAQKEIPIDHHMNTTELFQQLQYVGKDLLLETLPSIISKANQGIEQDENEVTYAPNIRREEEKIDFNKKCFEVHNLIRGLAMTPGAYCFFKGKTCKIFQTEFSDFKLSCLMEPGTLKIQDKRLLVCCADGYLEILKLQLEGKKMMTAKDFLNGHKIEQLEKEQLL